MASRPAPPRLRVRDVVARLLPQGSRIVNEATHRPGQGAWDLCPLWPPDLFAVSASLVGRSDCYAQLRQGTSSNFSFDDSYRQQVTELGRDWSRTLNPPAALQKIWSQLIADGDRPVEPSVGLSALPAWARAALHLMAIADEASYAMGFVAAKDLRFAHFVLSEANASRTRTAQRERALKHLPSSLCWLVPLEECCVLPKTRTPQVGVTLTSLSHYLALLPPVSSVYPRWMVNPREWEGTPDGPFNVLLVPFPYAVDGECFRAVPTPDPRGVRFFRVEQLWIPSKRTKAAAEFASFVLHLIDQASKQVGTVHGVVLPELALDEALYKALETALARTGTVEVLVSGIARAEGRKSFNEVRSSCFAKRRVILRLSQSKHHRWKLDRSQITRYQLGHALHPDTAWWEDIDVSGRGCTFYVFRRAASLAFLICEDLARLEPIQPAVRSVGPNLLVALLMDGPQWEKRWPGRYATVLADDPGSAVLTLTSLGMLNRSFMPGEARTTEIALWKEPSSGARELRLPAGAHALAITLNLAWETTRTFDGRTDERDGEGTSIRLTLGGVTSITGSGVAAWIQGAR